MNRKERFGPKEKWAKKCNLKYFVCCCPEENCDGDLMLMVDSDGLLTTNHNKGVEKIFKVHSKASGSQKCTERFYGDE